MFKRYLTFVILTTLLTGEADALSGGAGMVPIPATAPTFVMLNVPFYPDTTSQGGPSMLASVLSFWGRGTDPQKIESEMNEGPTDRNLVMTSKRHGMRAEITNGSLDQIKMEIYSRHPMILFINTQARGFPDGYYVVVTGYDEDRGGIYVHTADTQNKFVSYRRLMKGWQKSERWTLLVHPRNVQNG